MDKTPVRMLQIASKGTLKNGLEGVGMYIMRYAQYLDRSKIEQDIFIPRQYDCASFTDAIASFGGKIYTVNCFRGERFRSVYFFCQLVKLLRQKHYQIVEINSGVTNYILLAIVAAKLSGVKVIVPHAHNTLQVGRSAVKQKLFDVLVSSFYQRESTFCAGCGEDAVRDLLGDRICPEQKLVIKNALEIEQFAYNPQVRQTMRDKHGWSDCFVMGHVGRFCEQKNHDYLIDIFKEVYQLNKKARLLLIGIGELQGEIEQKVKRLGLQEVVVFAGMHKHINDWYQAMDVFVLPSLMEGLGIVLVEAQAGGLPCVVSSRVPKESKMTHKYSSLDLSESPRVWADEILRYAQENVRVDTSDMLYAAGYDIKEAVKSLETKYLSAVEERY